MSIVIEINPNDSNIEYIVVASKVWPDNPKLELDLLVSSEIDAMSDHNYAEVLYKINPEKWNVSLLDYVTTDIQWFVRISANGEYHFEIFVDNDYLESEILEVALD